MTSALSHNFVNFLTTHPELSKEALIAYVHRHLVYNPTTQTLISSHSLIGSSLKKFSRVFTALQPKKIVWQKLVFDFITEVNNRGSIPPQHRVKVEELLIDLQDANEINSQVALIVPRYLPSLPQLDSRLDLEDSSFVRARSYFYKNDPSFIKKITYEQVFTFIKEDFEFLSRCLFNYYPQLADLEQDSFFKKLLSGLSVKEPVTFNENIRVLFDFLKNNDSEIQKLHQQRTLFEQCLLKASCSETAREDVRNFTLNLRDSFYQMNPGEKKWISIVAPVINFKHPTALHYFSKEVPFGKEILDPQILTQKLNTELMKSLSKFLPDFLIQRRASLSIPLPEFIKNFIDHIFYRGIESFLTPETASWLPVSLALDFIPQLLRKGLNATLSSVIPFPIDENVAHDFIENCFKKGLERSLNEHLIPFLKFKSQLLLNSHTTFLSHNNLPQIATSFLRDLGLGDGCGKIWIECTKEDADLFSLKCYFSQLENTECFAHYEHVPFDQLNDDWFYSLHALEAEPLLVEDCFFTTSDLKELILKPISAYKKDIDNRKITSFPSFEKILRDSFGFNDKIASFSKELKLFFEIHLLISFLKSYHSYQIFSDDSKQQMCLNKIIHYQNEIETLFHKDFFNEETFKDIWSTLEEARLSLQPPPPVNLKTNSFSPHFLPVFWKKTLNVLLDSLGFTYNHIEMIQNVLIAVLGAEEVELINTIMEECADSLQKNNSPKKLPSSLSTLLTIRDFEDLYHFLIPHLINHRHALLRTSCLIAFNLLLGESLSLGTVANSVLENLIITYSPDIIAYLLPPELKKTYETLVVSIEEIVLTTFAKGVAFFLLDEKKIKTWIRDQKKHLESLSPKKSPLDFSPVLSQFPSLTTENKMGKYEDINQFLLPVSQIPFSHHLPIDISKDPWDNSWSSVNAKLSHILETSRSLLITSPENTFAFLIILLQDIPLISSKNHDFWNVLTSESSLCREEAIITLKNLSQINYYLLAILKKQFKDFEIGSKTNSLALNGYIHYYHNLALIHFIITQFDAPSSFLNDINIQARKDQSFFRRINTSSLLLNQYKTYSATRSYFQSNFMSEAHCDYEKLCLSDLNDQEEDFTPHTQLCLKLSKIPSIKEKIESHYLKSTAHQYSSNKLIQEKIALIYCAYNSFSEDNIYDNEGNYQGIIPEELHILKYNMMLTSFEEPVSLKSFKFDFVPESFGFPKSFLLWKDWVVPGTIRFNLSDQKDPPLFESIPEKHCDWISIQNCNKEDLFSYISSIDPFLKGKDFQKDISQHLTSFDFLNSLQSQDINNKRFLYLFYQKTFDYLINHKQNFELLSDFFLAYTLFFSLQNETSHYETPLNILNSWIARKIPIKKKTLASFFNAIMANKAFSPTEEYSVQMRCFLMGSDDFNSALTITAYARFYSELKIAKKSTFLLDLENAVVDYLEVYYGLVREQDYALEPSTSQESLCFWVHLKSGSFEFNPKNPPLSLDICDLVDTTTKNIASNFKLKNLCQDFAEWENSELTLRIVRISPSSIIKTLYLKKDKSILIEKKLFTDKFPGFFQNILKKLSSQGHPSSWNLYHLFIDSRNATLIIRDLSFKTIFEQKLPTNNDSFSSPRIVIPTIFENHEESQSFKIVSNPTETIPGLDSLTYFLPTLKEKAELTTRKTNHGISYYLTIEQLCIEIQQDASGRVKGLLPDIAPGFFISPIQDSLSLPVFNSLLLENENGKRKVVFYIKDLIDTLLIPLCSSFKEYVGDEGERLLTSLVRESISSEAYLKHKGSPLFVFDIDESGILPHSNNVSSQVFLILYFISQKQHIHASKIWNDLKRSFLIQKVDLNEVKPLLIASLFLHVELLSPFHDMIWDFFATLQHHRETYSTTIESDRFFELTALSLFCKLQMTHQEIPSDNTLFLNIKFITSVFEKFLETHCEEIVLSSLESLSLSFLVDPQTIFKILSYSFFKEKDLNRLLKSFLLKDTSHYHTICEALVIKEIVYPESSGSLEDLFDKGCNILINSRAHISSLINRLLMRLNGSSTISAPQNHSLGFFGTTIAHQLLITKIQDELITHNIISHYEDRFVKNINHLFLTQLEEQGLLSKENHDLLKLRHLKTSILLSHFEGLCPVSSDVFQQLFDDYRTQLGKFPSEIENHLEGKHLTKKEAYPPVKLSLENFYLHFFDYWRLATNENPDIDSISLELFAKQRSEFFHSLIAFSYEREPYLLFLKKVFLQAFYDPTAPSIKRYLLDYLKQKKVGFFDSINPLYLIDDLDKQLQKAFSTKEEFLRHLIGQWVLRIKQQTRLNVLPKLQEIPNLFEEAQNRSLIHQAQKRISHLFSLLTTGSQNGVIAQAALYPQSLGYSLMATKKASKAAFKLSSHLLLSSHKTLQQDRLITNQMSEESQQQLLELQNSLDSLCMTILESYFQVDTQDGLISLQDQQLDLTLGSDPDYLTHKLRLIQESLVDYYQRPTTPTKTYSLAKISSLIKIFTSLKTESVTLQKQLYEEENALSTFVHSKQFPNIPSYKDRLKIHRQKQNPVTNQIPFKTLLTSFICGELSTYKKQLSLTAQEDICIFEQRMYSYLILKTFLNKINLCLDLVQKLHKTPSEKILVQKLGELLCQKRVYSFDLENERLLRANLFFEEQTGLLLWEKQYVQMSRLLSHTNSRKALEAIMGIGKTSYMFKIAPYVLSRKNKIVISCFPQAVAELNTNLLSQGVLSLYQQKTYSRKIDRSNLRSLQSLEAFYLTLKSCLENKDLLTHTISDMQSLDLNFFVNLTQHAENKLKKAQPTLVVLARCLDLLKTHGHINVDEQQIIASPQKEKNYPLNKKQYLSKETIEITHNIMRLCLLNPHLAQKLQIDKNKQALLSQTQIQSEIIPCLAHILTQELKTKHDFDTHQSELMYHYLLGKSQEIPHFIESHEKKETFATIKGILTKILPSSLNAVSYVDYGPDTEDSMYEFAIVYDGNNNPVKNTIIRNNLEALVKTYMCFAVKPLTDKQGSRLISKLVKKMNAESEHYGTTKEQTPTYLQTQRRWNIKLTDQRRLDSPHFRSMLDNVEAKMLYVKLFPARQIFYYTEGLKANAINFYSMMSSEDDYSGTLYNQQCYYQGISSILDPGTIGQSIRILQREGSKENAISILKEKHPLKLLNEMFFSLIKDQPHTLAIIDSGALFKGFANELIAQSLHEMCQLHRPEILGIAFYNTLNQEMCYIKGKAVPLSTCGLKENQRLTFFDHIHTNAADISQAIKANALLTFGEKTYFETEILQGMWRLRGLETKEQTLTFVVPHDILHLIGNPSPTINDLIRFTTHNEEKKLLDLNFKAYKNKILDVFRDSLRSLIIQSILKNNLQQALDIFTTFRPLFAYSSSNSFFASYGQIDLFLPPLQILNDLKTTWWEKISDSSLIDVATLQKIQDRLDLITPQAHLFPDFVCVYDTQDDNLGIGESEEITTDESTDQSIQSEESTEVDSDQNTQQNTILPGLELFQESFRPTPSSRWTLSKLSLLKFFEHVKIAEIHPNSVGFYATNKVYQGTDLGRAVFSLKEIMEASTIPILRNLSTSIDKHIFVCNSMVQMLGQKQQQIPFGYSQKPFSHCLVIESPQRATTAPFAFILTPLDNHWVDLIKKSRFKNTFVGILDISFGAFLISNQPQKCSEIETSKEVSKLRAQMLFLNGNTNYAQTTTQASFLAHKSTDDILSSAISLDHLLEPTSTLKGLLFLDAPLQRGFSKEYFVAIRNPKEGSLKFLITNLEGTTPWKKHSPDNNIWIYDLKQQKPVFLSHKKTYLSDFFTKFEEIDRVCLQLLDDLPPPIYLFQHDENEQRLIYQNVKSWIKSSSNLHPFKEFIEIQREIRKKSDIFPNSDLFQIFSEIEDEFETEFTSKLS